MNNDNRPPDSVKFKHVVPWLLILAGSILMPGLWPIGAVLLSIGVAMIARATR